MQLTLNEIKRSYQAIKKIALNEYKKGDYEKSLEYVDKAVVLAQQFNWIYSDNELEDLLNNISLKICKDLILAKYEPIENRVVLFDDYCRTFVLALQYIEALIAEGKEILYITAREFSSSSLGFAIDQIRQYPNVEVKIIPYEQSKITKIRTIQHEIQAYRPSKCFLHLTANSISVPALYHLPVAVKKYLINLADQTFWLGSKALDFSFEFRSFGATVSYEMRGLKKEQLIYLPFYPIADNNEFQGFPEATKGKVVIFSGGDFYKTIDPQNNYWSLVKGVLDQNSEAIILYATKVDNSGTQAFLDNFISENNFHNRFIYIGFRSDINEVFRNCDIYMGTCPASGSLMSQLAALHSKPILQFYLPHTVDDETEAAICHNGRLKISFTEQQAFLSEAMKLIGRSDYRALKGQQIHECMLTKEQFNERFHCCLTADYSLATVNDGVVDYDDLILRWYWIEELGFIDTMQYVYSVLGSERCRNLVPTVWLKQKYRRYMKTKLFNLNWYVHRIKKIKNKTI